jgi:hypothetical protein
MKTLMALLITLGLLDLLNGAVVTTDISKASFDALAANTSKLAWTVYMEAGSPNGSSSYELLVSKPGSTPEARNLIWHTPEQITVAYDLAGNLNVDVGSTHVAIQPTRAFNMISIQIQDGNTGTTSFENFIFDGTAVRNLFADDPTETDFAYDDISLSNLSNTFSFSGNWSMGVGGIVAFSDSYMKIIGTQVTVPEPSSFFFTSAISLLLFNRKRTS